MTAAERELIASAPAMGRTRVTERGAALAESRRQQLDALRQNYRLNLPDLKSNEPTP